MSHGAGPPAPLDRYPLADWRTWLAAWLARRGLHPRLHAAVAAALLEGGKRYRALLVFAATDLVGTPLRAAYPVAGAVEAIHAYSLVHDDLPAMDDAALRRGRPTLHRRFGEALAILAGDALLTDAFALLTETEAAPGNLVAAVRQLADAAGGPGMVGGQVGDLLDLPSATELAVVRRIHAGKTGALIRWSLLAPVVLWYPEAPWRKALERFAEHLGVLYQVRDDFLDVDPTASRDKDRDADGAKATYPRLLGLERARAAAEAERRAAEAALAELPESPSLAALLAWTVGRRS